MRATVKGTIVQLDEGVFNGAPYYGVYLRDEADVLGSAFRVKMSAVQYGGVSVGEVVEWPVNVTGKGGGKTGFDVKLPEAFDVRTSSLAGASTY